VGGTFVLRIEDTDPERSRDDLIEGIERSLKWLGLDWDEGPYRQSERMHLYKEAAERLVTGGHAYYCDCTKADIEARNPSGGYDGFCRDLGLGPGPGRALRFRTPDSGETTVHDVIRGDVVFDNANLEDFVILRAGGEPMFILANAVDDADMRITHVLRGEDLLSSTPKVLLLRHALGYAPDDDPLYGHLPVIVNEKRQKLSKRRDDVALEEFRERGYLPEAMRNYLALLGWGPADGREIMPVAEMVAEFALEDVKPSPAFFDVQKLDHVNAEYIRALPVPTFVRDSLPWLEEDPPWPPENFDLAAFEAMAPFVQERVRTLSEVPGMVDFLFLDRPVIDPDAWEKGVLKVKDGPVLLREAAAAYTALDEWTVAALHQATLAVGEAHGLKLGKAQAPIRVAVTGRMVGPPLFESLNVLGRERTLARMEQAMDTLGPGP
jgi:glutamyl-tRNA synthetase